MTEAAPELMAEFDAVFHGIVKDESFAQYGRRLWTSNLFVVITNPEGFIQAANPAVRALLGRDPAGMRSDEWNATFVAPHAIDATERYQAEADDARDGGADLFALFSNTLVDSAGKHRAVTWLTSIDDDNVAFSVGIEVKHG